MPNSLKVKLSKLRYKGEITQEEYSELIKKLDGHDEQIRAKTIEEVIETYIDVICDDCSKCGGHCRHDDVMNMLEQMKGDKE